MQTVSEKVNELALEMLEENKENIKKEMHENYIRLINKVPDMVESLVDVLAESIVSGEGGDANEA